MFTFNIFNVNVVVVENGKIYAFPEEFKIFLEQEEGRSEKLLKFIENLESGREGVREFQSCLFTFRCFKYHEANRIGKICVVIPKEQDPAHFFSIVIHELKNPLAAIKAMTQVLVSGIQNMSFDRSKTMSYLKLIDSEIDRINRIFSSVIQLSRPNERFSEFDLVNVVSNAVYMWREKCNELGISLTFSTNKEELLFFGNPDEFSQILSNLISNSVHAVKGNPGGSIFVSLNEKKREKLVELKVEDNGMGMTPEQLDKIKEGFYTTKVDGLGMGLYIVKMLVEKNSGKIDIDSRPEKGTVVSIIFNLYEKDSID